MKNIKKYIKTISYITIIIIITTFILTILNYFNVINQKILSILQIISIIISNLIGGIKIGKKAKTKGWLEGLKLSFILISILLIINLIIKKLDFTNLIYYLIIIVSTTLGSMIGINKKL